MLLALAPTHLLLQVDEEDVARARNQLKASILFSQDGTTGRLGCALVFGCSGCGVLRCASAHCKWQTAQGSLKESVSMLSCTCPC